VNEAIAQGRFRSELNDPQMLAQLLWAGVHGVAAIHLAKPRDKPHPWIEMKDPGETAQAMVDVFLRGLLRNPTP
jgi:hypothetical protein